MIRKNPLLILSFFCLLLFCPSVPSSGEFDARLDVPGPKGSLSGICINSLEGNQLRYNRDGDKLFLPASVIKLLTTAVALVRLGPDFRYTTNLYADGPIRNNIVAGNLIVRGVGDPSLCDAFHDGRAVRVFEEWADRLLQQGIRRVEGDIIGDDTLFGREYRAPGWGIEYSSFYFSPPVSALSFNGNAVEITVVPGAAGQSRALVRVNPEAGYPAIIGSIVTKGGKEKSVVLTREAGDPLAGGGGIRVSGVIGVDSSPHTARVAVEDPSLYTVSVIRKVFKEKGIEVTGKASGKVTGKIDYDSMAILAASTSPPLSEIIIHVNKRSDNLGAELIYRTLGTLFKGDGSFAKSGEVVKETLAAMGIESSSLVVRDGSGLSRLNLVTPSQIVTLLTYMHGHPTFPYFYNSLPIAGVDGTLKNRMKKTAAEGRVHAKTGYLAHVVTLAGYVENGKGERTAFSIMSNNYPDRPADIKALHDRICIQLAE